MGRHQEDCYERNHPTVTTLVRSKLRAVDTSRYSSIVKQDAEQSKDMIEHEQARLARKQKSEVQATRLSLNQMCS